MGFWLFVFGRCLGFGASECGLDAFSSFGVLVFWAKPADESLFFLGGSLVVQGDEAREKLLFELFFSYVLCLNVLRLDRKIRPAIGFQNGGIEFVVELFEERDESLVVDDFVFFC